mgnify:CR=1 FL=1
MLLGRLDDAVEGNRIPFYFDVFMVKILLHVFQNPRNGVCYEFSAVVYVEFLGRFAQAAHSVLDQIVEIAYL